MEKITSVKGFNDITPPESKSWEWLEAFLRKAFNIYGFSEIRLPLLEKTELFTRSIGEVTDIVEKEMYSFTDKSGTSVTMRPEGTASAVRSLIEHKLYSVEPVLKLFYTGPMFRYERPQKGRLRQFHQAGCEVFGTSSPKAELELLLMLDEVLKKLGVPSVKLEINSLGCAICRPSFKSAIVNFLQDKKGMLCGDCVKRIDTNPLRVLDCKIERCKELTEDAPVTTEHLCDECLKHWESLLSLLESTSLPYFINSRLVRGLDYYTRTAFEFTSSHLGSQSAVAAGGRYDRLVEELGGPAIPAVGFGIGIERLMLLIPDESKPNNEFKVFTAYMGESAFKKSLEIVRSIRDKGVSCEFDYDGKSLKSQMRRADKLNCTLVVIIGDDEIAKGKASVKNLAEKSQLEVDFNELTEFILKVKGEKIGLSGKEIQ